MEKSFLNTVMNSIPQAGWEQILAEVWKIFADPLNPAKADALTTERDKKAGALDTLLSGAAWDLWYEVNNSPLRTSQHLQNFWKQEAKGKAILILDALSLREACWLLEQADSRGYAVKKSYATLAEFPGDTTPFAKALGFGQRSSLTDNGGKSEYFPGAYTESVDMPFADCGSLVKPETGVIFWHHWPDSNMHDLADDGSGAQKLTKAAVEALTGDDFWSFVDRLATGRKLVITGDHGYANAGLFRDLVDKEQIDYMKKLFKSGRSTTNSPETNHNWVPPLTIEMEGHTLALGRRKWKSQGGYPTLTHGGLSLLEMAVPFIEIEKRQG
jgi:hypothetical protein